MKKAIVSITCFTFIVLGLLLQGCSNSVNNTNVKNTPSAKNQVENSSTPYIENTDIKKEMYFEKVWECSDIEDDFETVVDGDDIFVISDNFTSLNKNTGRIQWESKDITNPIDSRLFLNSSIIAFTNGEGIYVLDRKTGNLISSYKTETETYSKPAEKDGIIYFTLMDGVVNGVDKSSGKLVWDHWIGPNVSDPVIVDNQIILLLSNNLYAIDLTSKEEVWKLENLKVSSFSGTAILSNSIIYLIGDGNESFVSAVDAYDRKLLWEKGIGSYNNIKKVLTDSESIYICASENKICKIDKADGDIGFELEVESKYGVLNDIALRDSRIFFVTSKGLYSIDTTGKDFSQCRVDIVNGKKIIIKDNELYEINSDRILTKYLIISDKDQKTVKEDNVMDDKEVNREEFIIHKDSIKIGQKIAGLEIVNIDRNGEYVTDITFSGEITVSGTFELGESEDSDGNSFVFLLDETSKKKIPVFEEFQNEEAIKINNTELAEKLLKNKTGKATIVIDNYSIGERQIMISADLVKLAE